MPTQNQYSIGIYLEQLAMLPISDNGQISPRNNAEHLITVGRWMVQHLSRALKGAGVALAEASIEDSNGQQWELASIGYLVSNVAEVIETIQAIENCILQTTPESSWPVEKSLKMDVSISQLFFLLPLSLNPQAHIALKNACECFMGTEILNIREYAQMLECATRNQELGRHTPSAICLLTEWTGFLANVQQIIVGLDIKTELSALAA